MTGKNPERDKPSEAQLSLPTCTHRESGKTILSTLAFTLSKGGLMNVWSDLKHTRIREYVGEPLVDAEDQTTKGVVSVPAVAKVAKVTSTNTPRVEQVLQDYRQGYGFRQLRDRQSRWTFRPSELFTKQRGTQTK